MSGVARTVITIVGTVVGAAAGFVIGAALGGPVGAAIGMSIGAGLGAAAGNALGNALFPTQPKLSDGGSQNKWKADPLAGIPYVMGRTLVGGNIVAKVLKGDHNMFLGVVTVLSLGPINAFETTYMNKTTMTWDRDPLATPYAAQATNDYSGFIWEHRTLGACPESWAPGVNEGYSGWTGAHKLSGLAAVFNTFCTNSKSEKNLAGLPQPGWIIEGVKVYDPRLDSTYPGGSGPCRALDESTYVYSETPHLHGLTWLIGRWQNGIRVAGIGAALSLIDVAAFVEGANLDEARGWKVGGQVYTRPDTPWNTLKAILQAGGSYPTKPRGLISCINRAPRVALATITHEDITGSFEMAGTQRRRARINAIVPLYRSEAHDWEIVPAQRISVAAWEAMDGDERTKEVTYPLVQDVDQVAQLATYDICEARELGPFSAPLKPKWLNYRIGDCVMFEPEPGFSVKALITGRSIDAQTGAVTLTMKSETDGKHAFALGQTGVAPPTASISYSDTIAAPTGDWALAGTALTDNGASVPALVLSGAVTNLNADAVAVDYRVYSGGMAAGDGWMGASLESPAITVKEITSVTPSTQYQVGVRYRVRGRLGPRAIFGPVAAGDAYPPGYLQQLIQSSSTSPTTGVLTATAGSTTTSITVGSHTRNYSDKAVSVSGSVITGLAYSTLYYVYYDDAPRAGGAVTMQATTDASLAGNSTTYPARHTLGSITTPASGGAPATGGGREPIDRR